LQQAFVKGVIVKGLARYLRRCQHIVTPSDSIRRMLSEHGVTERVTTIPTGIDIQPFIEADGRAVRAKYELGENKVLVSMGRLAKEKNWETLIQACALLMQGRTDVRLLLIGDGPQRDELEKFTSDLGIADSVTFAGRVPFDAVPGHLKAGDLFCFASVTETQGLATMEAMAAGLPVAAVEATGTSDVVDDAVDGLLTDNDSHALAEAIRRVLDKRQLRETLLENARVKVRQFDMMIQAQKLSEVYQQARRVSSTNSEILHFVQNDISTLFRQPRENVSCHLDAI
jgi:glycosyltransferase involved in cell wall biosynthesis